MIELFDCKALSARITLEQCRINRSRPLSASFDSPFVRPEGCRRCTQWKEFDFSEDSDAEQKTVKMDFVVQTTVESAPLPVAAPCAKCRFFRPLPTFYAGIMGVRFCWSEGQMWDFSCYQE